MLAISYQRGNPVNRPPPPGEKSEGRFYIRTEASQPGLSSFQPLAPALNPKPTAVGVSEAGVANRLFQSPRFVPHIAEYRLALVQIKAMHTEDSIAPGAPRRWPQSFSGANVIESPFSNPRFVLDQIALFKSLMCADARRIPASASTNHGN